MRYFAIPWLCLLAHASIAQVQTAADSLRPTSPVRLLRYTYANDLFFRTDYYFTQGMTLTLIHPALARSPANSLLMSGHVGSVQSYGIRLRYDGFTPLRIQDDFIRVGDRPHAAYGYASFFRTATMARRQRLTSAVEVGFIGPAAGGRELQTFLHQVTDNAVPRGWGYQIRNDAVLGYRVGYEQPLLTIHRHAELLATTEASLGTLYTYASVGTRLRVGPQASATPDDIGPAPAPGQRWQLLGHAAFESRVVGYDATLQGGLFNRSSPYVLTAADVRRVVFRSSGGLVLTGGNLSFSATAVWVSPEFTGARSHRWAQLGVTLRLMRNEE